MVLQNYKLSGKYVTQEVSENVYRNRLITNYDKMEVILKGSYCNNIQINSNILRCLYKTY